jgi:hypothetical protein
LPNWEVEELKLEEVCPVCRQPLDEVYAVTCVACGQRVHFDSGDSPESECSRIVSQFTLCGLAFICNDCHEQALAGDQTPPGQGPR